MNTNIHVFKHSTIGSIFLLILNAQNILEVKRTPMDMALARRRSNDVAPNSLDAINVTVYNILAKAS